MIKKKLDNKKKAFNIYPNPVKDILNLSEEMSWSLLNIKGQVLETGTSKTIDMSKKEQGLYCIKTKKGTVKVIKK